MASRLEIDDESIFDSFDQTAGFLCTRFGQRWDSKLTISERKMPVKLLQIATLNSKIMLDEENGIFQFIIYCFHQY